MPVYAKVEQSSTSFGCLKDDGIQRAKSYLTKVCRIDFPINSYEWNEVLKLNLFRNCIIHAQGDVDKVKSTTKLRNTIENTTGIGLKRGKSKGHV